jgi:gliding motility-associated-like protein
MKKFYPKNFYAYLLLCIGFFTLPDFVIAQTTLTAGDIAFTAYDSTPVSGAGDAFSFVLLSNISSGTKISFTDQGYQPTGWQPAGTTESSITWTSGTALPIGTEVYIVGLVASTYNPSTGTSVSNGTVVLSTGTSNNGLSLSNVGDQIIAFQGGNGSITGTGVTCIAGINYFYTANSTSASWNVGSANGPNSSLLPPGLTGGTTAFYTGAVTGNTLAQSGKFNCTGVPTSTAANVRIAVMNNANWTLSTASVSKYSGCTFIGGAPVITANPANRTICAAGTTTFTVSASGATSYQWYQNSGSGFAALTNTAPYSGVTTNTLTITEATAAMTGYQYRAVASNVSGSATSNASGLTVASISTIGSKTDVSCNGGSNGSATVVPSGGVAPYTYSWSPAGGTAATATGLSAGTYTVIVTDNSGCQSTRTFTISQPATPVSGTRVVTNVACNGGTNGTINLTPTGGTAPYTFNWGGGITTEDRTGLAAGTYTVIITDANGCTGTVNATVTQPATPVSATTVVTNIACNGGSNGSINLTPSGGSSPYTFNWGGGITIEDRTGLAAGTYTVIITDANGCTGTVSATVTQPATPVSGTRVVTNVACNGGTNGTINLTPTGGTAPYTFNWGGGITTEDRTGLAAGTYTVIITDANGCTGTVNATITQPATPVSATTVVTNIACNGGSNGTINLTPSGGSSPYTFNWGGGITTEDRTGLAAGTYTVIITDANGCTGTVNATVTQPATAVSGTRVVTNVACNGGTNGTINLTPTGGTAPYTFNWGGGITTEDRTGLAAGTYTVIITDVNGCSGTVNATVTQPATPVSATTVVTNIACNGGSNGSINLTPSGGASPYTFNWGGGITTEDRTGLAAGTYTVIITDANGCTGTVNATITQPATPVSGTRVVTNVACNGGTNGTINLTPTGGTAPYTFNWGGGITTEDRTGLAAGTYTVIITDANGCTGTVNATVTQPATPVSATTVVTNIACNGGSNGSINLTPSGGSSPYTFNWGGGITTEDRTGLAAGTYTVIITDANGCTGTVNATVTQPATAVSATTVVTNISCNGLSNGSINLTPAGGTSPYTFNWGGGITTEDRTGLAAGTYTVTITDANGCTAVRTATISQPSAIIATAGPQTNILCNGGSTGSATVNATGGSGGYTYSWSPSGGTSATATGLVAGNYIVTVTDANGCQKTQSFNITEPAALSITNTNLSQAQVTVPYNQNIDATGGSGTYTFVVATGNLPTGLALSTSGHITGTPTVSGTFNFTIRVSESGCGKTVSKAYTIASVSSTQTIDFTSIPVQTYGNSPLTLTATSSSSLPVTYASSNLAVATISGNVLTITGAGTADITASQVGGSGYDPSPNVVQTLTVNKANTTITFGNLIQVFDGSAKSATVTTTPVELTGLSTTYNGSATLPTAAGTYAVSTTLTNNNYTAAVATGNLIISPKTITVTTATKSKTYGDADPALAYTFAPALVGTDTFNGTLNRTPGENVGTYAINQGTLALNGNYTLNYVGADLTIGAKTITVTAAAKSKTYGNADPALTYTFAPALIGTDTFTGSLTRSPGENLGNYAINQGTLALNGNYTLNYVGADLTIGAKTITVTAAAKSKTYGNADPALTYTFAPALIGTDTFTGSLTRSPGENLGTYAINQGTLALNGNYTLTFVGADLAIGAKTITITAAAKSKTYGNADPALTYTFAPALVGTDTFTGSLTRSPGENLGTYAINQGTLALNGNYTLTYVGADLTIGAKTITVTAAAKSKTFGDADPALIYTFAPALSTGDSFSGSLSRAPGENVGTYAINQGTLALNGNYALTYVGADLTIIQKTVTVTAAAKSKTFGDADPALTYTFAPALSIGDSFSGSLSRAPGENIGTYVINQGSLALNSNYALTYIGADLTIIQKTVTVTAAAKSKTFGDADPAMTYTFAPALSTGDSFSGSLSRSPGDNVGTYAINQGTLALNSNYNLTYVGADLTISAKTITVTAAAKSKTFGDADPALTYTFAPALGGTDVFTGSLSRSPGDNVGTYAINQGTLALNSNYNLTYVGADLTISAKTITVTAAAQSKTFGDADPALTYTFAPALLTGDSFSGSLSRAPGENVGAYAINQGTLALNGNYTLTYVGADLTIGAKTITVTAAAKSKTFGDADPTLTYTFAPALGTGDSFSGSLTRAPGENIGIYAINLGTLALNSNYIVKYVGSDLTIGAKTITVTAAAKSKTYGDADPGLTYTFTPALLTGDTFTGSLTRVSGENVGTYVINQGTLVLNSNNYTLTYINSNLRIQKASLTVTANNVTICQSENFPAFTSSYSGFKAGETENSLSTKPAISTTANRNLPGSYQLIPSGGVSGNYEFVYVNGSLTINALPNASIISDKGDNLSKGETAILTASGGVSYSWSAASGIISGQNTATLTIRPSQTTTYTVRVTNSSGCSSTKSITITIAEDFKLIANNILTPNGDGVNDTWIVKNIDLYPENELRIIDRNGREMYRVKSYNNTWDGSSNGTQLAEGTYYYIITYGPGKFVQKGFITITRNR